MMANANEGDVVVIEYEEIKPLYSKGKSHAELFTGKICGFFQKQTEGMVFLQNISPDNAHRFYDSDYIVIPKKCIRKYVVAYIPE